MAKISLCMIVGNVEDYIERCLTSFAPIADEIVMVRAIGNQVPDETFNIADRVCEKLGIPLKFDNYKNKPGHETWPHVDDFASARQQSFDLASGDYCFWADSDDILLSGAEVVRELANRGGYPVFMFPYDIFGRGVVVPRERMILRGSGRWRYQVHECFKFHVEPVSGCEDSRVVVRHVPHISKSGSNERNLTILKAIPPEEMNAGLWYHLQGELAGTGDLVGSVEAAKSALACPELGTPERYELFLNLGRMATEQQQKITLFHQAYAADPTRREAIGLLVSTALDAGLNEQALAYARQMMATIRPNKHEWNDREAAYGWLGNDLYAQALRAAGYPQEAELVRQECFRQAGGVKISLIHATRGRPQKAAIARKVWLDFADHPEQVEHIFVFDKDDDESMVLSRMHHAISNGGGCVAAWNYGAFQTSGPVVVQMSDDWTPPPSWDTEILNRIGDPYKPAVLAVSDGGRKDKLLCIAIATRAYLAQDYFFFHPSFTGVYSDNWFTEQAYARKQVIEARDLVFHHNHPAFQKGEVDETYVRQNSPERYAEGLQVINRLRAGTDWSSVPGFFNYWAFYRAIAKNLHDGDTVAEIGVWLGRSIIFLAQECQRLGKRVKFYAIDTFKGESNQKEHEATVRLAGGSLRASFEANLKRCGVTDVVTIIEGDSAESAIHFKDKSLNFVFIDAAHDYESVKRDVAAWLPKVVETGILSGHDADHEPVFRAVKELIPTAQAMGAVWMK